EAVASSKVPNTAIAAVKRGSAASHRATGSPETSRFGATEIKPQAVAAMTAALISTGTTWLYSLIAGNRAAARNAGTAGPDMLTAGSASILGNRQQPPRHPRRRRRCAR